MTQKQAAAKLAAFGMTLRKEDGEYRVNFRGAGEDSAYYTNDLDDAVSSAVAMHERKHYRADCARSTWSTARLIVAG